MSLNNYIIYTDGGSRGNPGEAAYGFVVYRGREKIFELGVKIGHATNNVAEYQGVLNALKWVEKNGGEHSEIEFFTDSELLAHQLSGHWKIKNPGLLKIFGEIRELETRLRLKTTFTAIRREYNREADRMVNLALDGII